MHSFQKAINCIIYSNPNIALNFSLEFIKQYTISQQ